MQAKIAIVYSRFNKYRSSGTQCETYVYNVFYQHFWIRNQNDMGIIYEKIMKISHLYTQK